MSLSTDAQVAVAERLEFLEAAHPVLLDALFHARRLAQPEKLRLHEPDELLFKIREAVRDAVELIDGVVNAEAKRGMEEKDAETMLALNSYGYTALSDKGKLEALAAQKRIERDQRTDAGKSPTAGTRAGEGAPSLTLYTQDR